MIPPRPWYSSRLAHVLAGGILPFGSIFIEMYFVFTAFWHYKYYYVYGFLLLVYGILLIVTACVTIVSTYFLVSWQFILFLHIDHKNKQTNNINYFLFRFVLFFSLILKIIDGNGLLFFLERQPLSTFICTPPITLFGRRKCLDSFRQPFTLATCSCSVLGKTFFYFIFC